ncbi:MAG: histidine utilization repressor [Acidobacteriota bacterium]
MSLAPVEADSPVPLYQQIKDRIRGRIRAGHWSPGRRIPSENQLVRALDVSRMTVNRALTELSQEGILERVAGRGTFVAEPPRHASLLELRNIADEIAAGGGRHRSREVLRRSVAADDELAARLELDAGSAVFQVILVHLDDEVPIQLEERWVNPRFSPTFLDIDFAQITPSEHLLDLIEPEEMEHIVQAVTPDGETAALLALDPTEPCLRLLRRTWNGGEVVTAATLTYPSSRYDLGARYRVVPPIDAPRPAGRSNR